MEKEGEKSQGGRKPTLNTSSVGSLTVWASRSSSRGSGSLAIVRASTKSQLQHGRDPVDGLKGKSPLASDESRDSTEIDASGLGDGLSGHAAGVDDLSELITDRAGADYTLLRHDVVPEEVAGRAQQKPRQSGRGWLQDAHSSVTFNSSMTCSTIGLTRTIVS
jgi:hypothetical protein